MQKKLKNKLEKMEKDQLVEIVEELCNSKETERMLKLMLAPTKTDIDRVLQKVSKWAEVYIYNSCSYKDYDKMLAAMEPIYAAIKYADPKTSAYLIYEVYQIARENELFEIDSADFVIDLLDDLRSILARDGDLFSNEERNRYRGIAEE